MLDAKPGLLMHARIENSLSEMPKVSIGWLEDAELVIGPLIGICKHNDVVPASPEGVWEICHWFNYDLRIVSRCLIAGGPIVIPIRYVFQLSDDFIECA